MSTEHHVDQVADASVATASSTTPSLSALPQARRRRRRRGRQLVKAGAAVGSQLTPEQRLLVLDTRQRSGLPAGDFAPLCGVSKHTRVWLEKALRRARSRRLGGQTARRPQAADEGTKPRLGVERISHLLLRGPALPVSPHAVARVLHEAGYVSEERCTKPHRDKIRRFERARPGQLWQTDLFSFVLKRQNRRVHLVAFMDDHSRHITCWGLHATASAAMVLEVLRSGIANYQAPEEILTDNGPQYITWRGVSTFAKECEKRGIKQIVATPRRPQTLGKVERFWGTLWRECLEAAIFIDLGDAQKRIGHFIDYYNVQRPHGGIDGLVPADRFFGAAPTVLDLARNGALKAHTHHFAASHDHPDDWTSNDIEQARQHINHNTLSPKTRNGLSPHTIWQRRSPSTETDRLIFRADLVDERKQARTEFLTSIEKPDYTPTPSEEAAIERLAITRCLIKHSALSIRTRHIPCRHPNDIAAQRRRRA